MKHAFMAFVALVVLILIFAVGYWLNFPGVHVFLGAANDALTQVFGALFVGIKIVFFAGLCLGIAYAVIELRKRNTLSVIGHGKHGPSQAFIHNGQVHQLASPAQQQIDPAQQLNMLKTILQMQGQMQKLAHTSIQEVTPEQQQIAAPEHIGAIVKYADVQDEVPDGMSLLGIHPSDGSLELSDWEHLKMLWIIGSSSTGKSNTVYGKALEARNHGAKLLVVDQHANKPDSLARKLQPLKDAFLQSIAVTDDQVLSTLATFKREFERRVQCPICARGEQCTPCSQKIVLIMDEINRMARNETLLAAIKEIVAIGGEESRGFGMYVWAISQKAVYLKWLRDSAITVIAHRVTRMEEALLACNDDLKAARKLLTFPVGRSFIYGVDFDELIELQQPLYEAPEQGVIEATIEDLPSVDTEKVPSVSPSINNGIQQEGTPLDGTFPFDAAKLKKISSMLKNRCTQQDIVCEVWKVEPSTRAFNNALAEYREMLAYVASMVGEN